jgi:hypothetical protein
MAIEHPASRRRPPWYRSPHFRGLKLALILGLVFSVLVALLIYLQDSVGGR